MKSLLIGAHGSAEDIQPPARAIDVGGVFVSAIDVEDDTPIGDRELLLRVAELRGALLDRATFIAIRYGFAAKTDAEAVARCAPFVPRWRSTLDAEDGRVEMTLKVVSSTPVPRPDRKTAGSGAAYLRALHDARRAVAIDPGIRAAAERLLLPLTVAHRWLPRDESSVELVMLAGRDRLPAIAASGEALREACPSAAFLLSGPWPLEIFADADRE